MWVSFWKSIKKGWGIFKAKRRFEMGHMRIINYGMMSGVVMFP